jgi:glycine/D-amino acid oxidase-like deaminating enzyme
MMLCDVVVVGRGFWGAATALMARHSGLSCVVVDDVTLPGASAAASGYASLRWYKGAWKARAAESLQTGETLFGHRLEPSNALMLRRNNTWVDKSDWQLFMPMRFLDRVAVGIQARAERIDKTVVSFKGGGSVRGRLVVVAAGAYTDELLVRSGLPPVGVSALWGAGSILDFQPSMQPAYRGRELLLQEVTPFHAHTARRWGGSWLRVGETTAKTREGALGGLEGVVRSFRAAGVTLPLGEGSLVGPRPVLARGEPFVGEVSPGVVVATGGGKVGAALAFWAAAEALKFLR